MIELTGTPLEAPTSPDGEPVNPLGAPTSSDGGQNGRHSLGTSTTETILPELEAEAERHDGQHVLDLITYLFTKTPLMAILAAIITYIGALDIGHLSSGGESSEIKHDISHVNPLYGPGTFFSWLLAVHTYMYDEYYLERDRRAAAPLLKDKSRLVVMVGYGLMAYLEQIGRAWEGDFGHAEAAARYVGDKAFEAFVIVFGIIIWRDYHSRRILPKTETESRYHSPYSYWPPLVFIFAWAFGRALEHNHDFYVLPRDHPEYKCTWKPLIPYEFRYISLPIGIIIWLATTRGGPLNRISEGILKVFWLSSMVLHNGLFGTVSPFRLTALDIRSWDQWGQLAFVSVPTVLLIYWRDFLLLPKASWTRAKNVVKWKDE